MRESNKNTYGGAMTEELLLGVEAGCFILKGSELVLPDMLTALIVILATL